MVAAGVVVHENGKHIRCRLLETWQVADGRLAQLVESIDSGEKITVVADPAAQTDGRAMPVRIFMWGVGRQTPPEGSPIPPRLSMGPQVAARNEPTPLPPNAPAEKVTRGEIARMVADGGFSPAEITAAKIMLDETQAKARQAAVKYLASVDCHYYPEAEISLIATLRADRSENVRLEAAQALGNCRGVTVRILDALRLTATGQETDGNPAETSDQVRSAASNSLNRLLSAGMSMEMAPPPLLVSPMPTNLVPANYVAPAPPSAPLLQQEPPARRDRQHAGPKRKRGANANPAADGVRNLAEPPARQRCGRRAKRHRSTPARHDASGLRNAARHPDRPSRRRHAFAIE